MHAARTPAHRADVAGPTQDEHWQSPPARGRPKSTHLPPDGELLATFGDAIDDRIAEVVDELLEERNAARQRRPGRYMSAVALMLAAALTASALLRHNPIAWTIWPSAAAISLATAWTARAGRS
jgi:hypothetical protein